MDDTNESKTVKAGGRTYFFDLKETQEGDPYLAITESWSKGEDDEWERSRLLVFPDHAQEFLEVAQEMVGKLG